MDNVFGVGIIIYFIIVFIAIIRGGGGRGGGSSDGGWWFSDSSDSGSSWSDPQAQTPLVAGTVAALMVVAHPMIGNFCVVLKFKRNK